MDADAHIEARHVRTSAHLADRLDDGETHVDAEDGVVGSRVRTAADAVVTVAEDLDAQLVVDLRHKMFFMP